MPVQRTEDQEDLKRFGFNTTEGESENNGKKQKKHKKRNREAKSEEVPVQQTIVESIDEPVVEAQEKKNKKKDKKRQKVEDTNQNEQVETQTTAMEGVSAQEEKKKKKKEKKERREKRQQQQSEEVAQETQTEEQQSQPQEEESKRKNKSKKEKRQSEGQSTQETHNNDSAPIAIGNYKEHPNMKSFTADEVNKFRADNRISVSFIHGQEETQIAQFGQSAEGVNDMKPVRAFSELVVSDPSFLDVCKTFSKPTPIQSQCWPFVFAGKDTIGLAETGSGKTIAFGIPALVHIKEQKPIGKNQGPIVLVMSPTRELAMQTADVFFEAGKSIGLRSACFYGGVDKGAQYDALKKGIHVLVATPGRLIDLIQEGSCNLGQVSYLVLDEADRMLDIGFEKDIRKIMEYIPAKRQTIMFSATWPLSIQNLAHTFLRNPVKVTVGSAELAANHNVKQIVEVLQSDGEKDKRLLSVLKNYHKGSNRIIIFVLYKKDAPRVESLLQRSGYKVIGIHGDKSQVARFSALEEFKKGTTPLLVATDVAARGLDIPDVEYVINYSFPLTIEDYVHRIGRTGRAGKKGVSHTFFTNFDRQKAAELIGILQESNSEIPEDLRKLGSYGTAKKPHKLYGDHYVDVSKAPMPKKTHFKFDDDN